MSLYSSFAESMIGPLESSIAPLQRIITEHEDTQNSIQSIVNSMTSLNGTGSLSGLTGASVAHANQQLTQMTNQQLNVLKQAIAAIKSCSNSSTEAVSAIESALPVNRFIEQIFQHFDILGVIMNGRSIVDAAIEAVKEAFIQELESGIGIIDIAAAVFEVFGPIEAEVPPYIMKLYTAANEIMSVMRMLEQLTAMATGSPVKELFSTIPAFSSNLVKVGNAQNLKTADATNLRYGVVNANPTILTAVETVLVQMIAALLGKPITPQKNPTQITAGTQTTAGTAGKLGAAGAAGANKAATVNVAGIPITIPQNLGPTGVIVVAAIGILAIFALGKQRPAPMPQPAPGFQALTGGQPATGTGAVSATLPGAGVGTLPGTGIGTASATLPTTGSVPLPTAHPLSGTATVSVHQSTRVPSYHPNALGAYYSAAMPAYHSAATSTHSSALITAATGAPKLSADAQIAARPPAPMGVSESGFGPAAMGMSASAMIGMAIMSSLGQGQGGGGDNSPKANILS